MKDPTIDSLIRSIERLIPGAQSMADAAEQDGESLSRHALEIDGDPAYSFEQVNAAAGDAQAARYRAEALRDRVEKLREAIRALEESEEILAKR